MPEIQVLILTTNQGLISEVEEVEAIADYPNCRLVNPYFIYFDTPEPNSNQIKFKLIPWLNELTENKEIMIHSSKILTMVEPNESVLELYKKLNPKKIQEAKKPASRRKAKVDYKTLPEKEKIEFINEEEVEV